MGDHRIRALPDESSPVSRAVAPDAPSVHTSSVRLLGKLILVTLVIAVSPQLSSNIVVDGVGAAVLAAFVYGLLFVLLGWAVWLVVGLFSIVPGILTLGLFFLLVPTIVSAVLLKLTAGLIGSFEIRTWTAAFVLGLALGIVNWLFESAGKHHGRIAAGPDT